MSDRSQIVHRRFSPTSLAKVRAEEREGKSPVIAGYGAVFYDGTEGTEYKIGSYWRERLMPGAFDRALAEGHDCRCLFNHDVNHVLGRTASGTCKLSIDARGLAYECEPNSEDTDAMNVVAKLKRGDVSGSSFSFRIRQEEYVYEEDQIIALIKDVDLYDVGPVTFPAYEATEASVRSADLDARKAAAEEARAKAAAGKGTPRSVVIARARCLEIKGRGIGG